MVHFFFLKEPSKQTCRNIDPTKEDLPEEGIYNQNANHEKNNRYFSTSKCLELLLFLLFLFLNPKAENRKAWPPTKIKAHGTLYRYIHKNIPPDPALHFVLPPSVLYHWNPCFFFDWIWAFGAFSPLKRGLQQCFVDSDWFETFLISEAA